MKLPIPFLHRWVRGTWGGNSNLDCRECRVCGRFEIIAYGQWRRAARSWFSDARFTEGSR